MKLIVIIGFGVFCLLGYYLLRVNLWNTFGEEIIEIGDTQISYTANYGWFKEQKKLIPINGLTFNVLQADDDEHTNAYLVLNNKKMKIESVIKLPETQVQAIVEHINCILKMDN